LTVPVQRLASILRAHGGLALLLLAVAVLFTAGSASLLPGRYTATAQVLVGGTPAPGRDRSGDAGARDTLLATQPGIVTSGRVALNVVDALRVASDPAMLDRWRRATGGHGAVRHFAADRLLERVHAQPVAGSGLLAIAFTGDDPASAARGANAFARAYVETLAEIRDDAARRFPDKAGRRGEAAPGALEQLDAVVLDAAREPARSDGPGPLGVAAAGLGAGLLLALAGVAVAEMRRPGVHSAADLAAAIGERTGSAGAVEVLRAAFPGGAPRAVVAGVPAVAGGVETGTFAMHDGPETRPLPARTDGVPAVAGRRLAGPAPGGTPPSGPALAGSTPAGSTPAGSTPAVPTGEAPLGPMPVGPASLGSTSFGPAPVGPTSAGPPSTNDRGTTRSGADGARAPLPGAGGGSATAVAPERERSREPIGALLVRTGLIHPPEVERTLAWARQEGLRFGEAAVARRLVTPHQLERALASQFDYPLLDAGLSAVSPEVVAAFDPRNPLLADLRRIRARLDGALPAGGRCIAVIAPGTGAGRSFLAANLAVCIAQAGRRTLLVDADLHDGRQHLLFGLPNRTGLSSMLNDRIEPGALQRVAGLDRLTVIPCGPVAPNPAELLSRGTFGHLLASFRQAYDTVILDTSGTLDEPDAALVARHAGAALLVARRDATPLRALEATVAALRDDRIVIAAAVFNRS
jgi:protein-tyrosine kinase